MTISKIKIIIQNIIYGVICFTVCLLQTTGVMTLQIGTASTVLVLPLIIYAGFFFGEYSGMYFGLIFGALCDTYSSTLCYNTVILMIIGVACGLFVKYLFNANLASAIVLNVASAIVYFFIKWLVFYAFVDPACMFILYQFTLPSAIYTAACGVLVYFIINPILNKTEIKKKV